MTRRRKVPLAVGLLERLRAVLIHDLRMPLILLEQAASIEPKVRAAVENILRVANREARLGTDCRVDYGTIVPRTLIDEVAAALRAEPRWQGVSFTTDGTSEPLWADPGLIEHAVRCLAYNGAAACLQRRDDAGQVHIEVTKRPRTGGFIISVRDDGDGMAPAVLRTVLSGRAAVSGKRIAGVGIGIATVLSIARRHGGRLTAESRLGHGSTFRLHLPRDHNAPPRG